jgi:ABC-type uncharacterized transport system ATPase subunit
LEADNTIKAAEVLRQIPGITEVSPFGRSLHILTEADAPTKKNILKILAEAEVAVASLEQVPPRLEDVFIYLAQTDNAKNKT